MLTAIILAVSISSSKIDTFMRLPNWMPTSVDAAHTFGSDEHTNATRRTTFDTISAVESVFDAYYERAFFMSEGRSNDWNTAKYGPRPSSAQVLNQVEFTNFTGYASSMFVYRPAGTNETDYPRQVTDTRRLVEFGNLFALADKITLDIFDDYSYGRGSYPGIFLPYSPTWKHEWNDRIVYPGSSWMPGNLAPENFDWREGFPDLQEWAFTNCCLPVWECAADGVFKTSDEYRSDQNFQFLQWAWLETFNFGDLLRWGDGYLYDLTSSRPWVTNTVPDLVRAKFPAAGPEAGITNRTRRLVTDDYLTYDVTFEETLIESKEVTLDLSEVRPEDSAWGGEMDYDYDYTRLKSYEFDFASNTLTRASLETSEWTPAYDAISWSGNKQVDAPDDYDRVEVFGTSPYAGGYVLSDAYGGDGLWHWDGSEAGILFNFYKNIATTNAVHTNSSIVATESRILSMLDRSYEIASRAYITSLTVTSNRTRTVSASSTASGYAPIVYDYAEDEWTQGTTANEVILDTQTATVTPIHLSQGDTTRTDETTDSAGNADTRSKFRFSGVTTTLSPVTYYSKGFGVSLATNGILPIAGTGFTYTLRPYAGGRVLLKSEKIVTGEQIEFEVTLTVDNPRIYAEINVGQSAKLFTTTPAIRDSINRIYPWYGPGRLSFSTGRVGECIVTLGSAVELLVGIRHADGLFRDEDGWTSPAADLDWYNYVSESDYSRKFYYTVRNEQAFQNATAANMVATALGSGGWARNKLVSLCEDAMGMPFSPSMLNPDLSEIVRNADDIAKYMGGHFYIKCKPSGDKCLPHENDLEAGFAVSACGETPEVNYEKAFTAPVSADLLLSDPLISTQWNWKALKSSTNE